MRFSLSPPLKHPTSAVLKLRRSARACGLQSELRAGNPMCQQEHDAQQKEAKQVQANTGLTMLCCHVPLHVAWFFFFRLSRGRFLHIADCGVENSTTLLNSTTPVRDRQEEQDRQQEQAATKIQAFVLIVWHPEPSYTLCCGSHEWFRTFQQISYKPLPTDRSS